MKDYKQFLADKKLDKDLSSAIAREVSALSGRYEDKTERELITIAAKNHGYSFTVWDMISSVDR